MLEYVKEMRTMIGKKPLLLCGASTIIVNDEKEVLLLKRTDNNSWCFPGGAIELGEKVEQAAIREVKEETGLEINVKDLELFQVFSGKDMHYIYPNGDEVYIVDTVYITKQCTGEIKLDLESNEYGFFNIEEFPDKISPPVIPVVNRLKDHYVDLAIFK